MNNQYVRGFTQSNSAKNGSAKPNSKGVIQSNKFVSRNSMGFTLIELLVVISIIGILSTIIFANITSARSRVRDAIRVSDVKKILSALESYKLENGHYPCTSGAYNSYSTSLDSQFMRELVWGDF